MGGWSAAKTLRSKAVRMKSDERILGDGEFVETVLKAAAEEFETRYALRAQGWNLDAVAERVSQLTGLGKDRFMGKGKHPETVRARSLMCFWACRELGMKTTELAQLLGISQPSVSQSVRRGEELCKETGWQLLE
jgi:hypothetical protein